MPMYQSKLDSPKTYNIESGGQEVNSSLPANYRLMAEVVNKNGQKENWMGIPSEETPAETPSFTSNYSRPAAPELSPEATIQNKYEAQEAMAYAAYQRRMLNAGAAVDPKTGMTNYAAADEVLVGYANAAFQNDMADLQNWRRTLKGRFALVDKDNSLSDEQKNLFRSKIISQAKDAIYIPEMSPAQMQPKEKPLFSDSKVLTTAGKMVNKITEGGTTQDAYGVANAELGLGWEQRYPELVDIVNQQTTPQDTAGGDTIRVMNGDGAIGTILKTKLAEAKKADPKLKVL